MQKQKVGNILVMQQFEKRNHDILFEAMVCSPQNIVPNICFGHTNVLEVKRNCMCSCVGVGCTAHANAVGCTARAANKIDVGQECKDLCFLSTKLLTLIWFDCIWFEWFDSIWFSSILISSDLIQFDLISFYSISFYLIACRVAPPHAIVPSSPLSAVAFVLYYYISPPHPHNTPNNIYLRLWQAHALTPPSNTTHETNTPPPQPINRNLIDHTDCWFDLDW